MKTIQLLYLVAGIILTSLTWSCEDRVYQTYMANKPVYMNYEEFRAAVKNAPVKNFEQPGKIYLKDNYIFVNEYLKGIHVINNSNPASPIVVAFIEIPGNLDMSIVDNRLFADSYMDLVEIDISDLQNVKETARIKDHFPYTLPPYNEEYPLAKIDYTQGVIVDWELKEVTEEIERQYYPIYYDYARNESLSDGSSGESVGIGGSMARFTITSEVLYTTSTYQLSCIDIRNSAFQVVNKLNIGWDVETIFPNGNYLFFGTQQGMLIYDITIALSPVFLAQYSHITSCDPVVVKDTIAYVTLRSGNTCGSVVNRLDIISLSKINEPKLIHSVAMTNPHGLGISDSLLFICDGDAGLKIYNAKNPLLIHDKLLAQFSNIHAFDVIPQKPILILIGEDGLYQYNFSDPENIVLLSNISM